MAKLPEIHPYSDRTTFNRLMLVIATLAHHPGAGSRSAKDNNEQDSLESLRQHMQTIEENLGLSLPDYSVHTLRKDLATLRKFSILDANRHDWGYYIGTGAMNREELQLALNALASQATFQGDPQTRRTYQRLSQRLKCLNIETKGQLFYPVRAHFNRAIVHTDPEEMMHRQENRSTLFHQLKTLEAAIVAGQAIEIYLSRNLYNGKTGYRRVYPLQLLYYDIAWYLVMEDCENGHLAISRLDRLKDYLEILDPNGRGLTAQQHSLQLAYQLLQNGWGLNLGSPEEQQQERQGTLPLTLVKVRFFPPASHFIQEGERRHAKQKIVLGPPDPITGDPAYLDYRVKLPDRSLEEFRHWVSKHLDNAQILAPPALVAKQYEAARRLVGRYTGDLAQLPTPTGPTAIS